MTHYRPSQMLLVAVLAAVQPMCSAQASGPRVGLLHVQISSRWGGLGTPAASELMIEKEKSGFRLGLTEVDPALLSKLVSALKEPVVAEPNLANLGISKEWLVKNHDVPPLQYEGGPYVGAPNQKALYRKRFEDPVFVSRLLSTIFKSGFHSDDYPSMQVRLTFEDGSVATACSNSQQAFMLPWRVKLGGATHLTYNANFARALAAILPTETVNRARISGEGLLEDVRTVVAEALEPELNLLDADNRAADALAALRQRYSVVEAEINEYHHPEYGTEWSRQPRETNFHAALTRPDLPPNVVEALVLQYNNGRAEGLAAFLESASRYEGFVLSIPWLIDYVREHDKVAVRISYVHNASFGEKALRVFAADMRVLGRDDLIREARTKQPEVVLLIIGDTYAESYWLVFPDKHVVLWRYNGPSGLLKWKPSDFRTAECADYGVPFGGCVGATIDPDGNLTPTEGRIQ